ncbi:MAG TPA: hypothetical protein VMJ75_27200 [Candidatus Acidoferrales bacterium]|nr:hypothetical protein [Candidatus Acidoferrales bacterium]
MPRRDLAAIAAQRLNRPGLPVPAPGARGGVHGQRLCPERFPVPDQFHLGAIAVDLDVLFVRQADVEIDGLARRREHRRRQRDQRQ